MKLFSYLTLAAFCVSGGIVVAEEEKEKEAPAAPNSVFDFKVNSLDGKEVEFSKYKGKVLLIVNVASECGATPQYEQLQALHQQYAKRGLVVMGFPCNQFGRQEPGNSTAIKQFCSTHYGVKFPMFQKIDVNGDKQAKLYDFLKSRAEDHSDIGWNFEKFLVGKDGNVAARFNTGTLPDAPEVVKLLEEELSK